MSDEQPAIALPAAFHILLCAGGATDFRRAGTAVLDTMPVRGAMIEVHCDGRELRGLIEAVIIPPGCEENCVGTVFLSEG
jgi:hypothetical protein